MNLETLFSPLFLTQVGSQDSNVFFGLTGITLILTVIAAISFIVAVVLFNRAKGTGGAKTGAAANIALTAPKIASVVCFAIAAITLVTAMVTSFTTQSLEDNPEGNVVPNEQAVAEETQTATVTTTGEAGEVTPTPEPQPQPQPEPEPVIQIEVTGSVTPDYAAGKDYSGFTVEAISEIAGEPPIPSVTTSEDGSFTFPNIPLTYNGQFRKITFKVSKTGYETKEITINSEEFTPGEVFELEAFAPTANKINVFGNVIPNAWDEENPSSRYQGFAGIFTADDETTYEWSEADSTYDPQTGAYSMKLPFSFTGKLAVSKSTYVTKEITFDNITAETSQNVEISATTYKIVFNVNKPEKTADVTSVTGASEDPRPTLDITSYTKYTLDANVWSIIAKQNSQKAYNFIGWSTKPGTQTVEYADGAIFKYVAQTEGETFNLYGQWDGVERFINVYYFEYDGINHVTDPTQGISVKESIKVSSKYYEAYSIEAEDIDGYTCITSSPVTGITPNYDSNVIFEYQLDTFEAGGEIVNEGSFTYDLSGFNVTFQGTRTSPTGTTIQKTYTTKTYKDENNKYVYKFDKNLDYGLTGTLQIQSPDNSFASYSKTGINIEESITFETATMKKLRRTLSGSVISNNGSIEGASVKLTAGNGVWIINEKELTLNTDGTFKYDEDGGMHYGSVYTLTISKTGYRTIVKQTDTPVTINVELNDLALEPIVYTINFHDTKKGESTTTDYTQSITYDKHPNLDKKKFADYTGYTFNGWDYYNGTEHVKFADQAQLTTDLTTEDGAVLQFNTEYVTNKYDLTIKRVDENNAPLQVWDEGKQEFVDIDDVVKNMEFDSTFEHTAEAVAGYTPTAEKFTYKMDAEGKTVKATYTKNTYTLKAKVESEYGPDDTKFTDNSGFEISDGTKKIQTPENGTVTFGTYKYLDEVTLSSSKLGYSTDTQAIKFTSDEDITQTFKNEANSYTVKFAKGEGTVTGEMADQTMYYDVSASLTENAFEKTNYEFGNWKSSKNLTYKDKDSVKNLCNGTESDKEITLTAQWIAKEGSLTINIVPVDGQESWGQANPAKVFATTGYSTASYNTETKQLVINDSSTSKTSYVSAVPATDTEGQYTYSFVEFTDIPSGTITGDTCTIHVKFKQEVTKYDVTVSANNEGYGKIKYNGTEATSQTVIVEYGSTWAVSENKLTVTTPSSTTHVLEAIPTTQTPQYDYAFSEWSPDEGTVKTARAISANFTRTLRSYTVSGTVSVSTGEEYAKDISVTCNCPTPITVITDEDGWFTMDNVPYSEEGHTFTLSKGANSGYIDYTSENIPITSNKGDCDFVNKLVPITYSIKFNSNIEGAEGTMDDITAVYDTESTLTANAFSHPKNDFIEWNTSQDGTGDTFEDEATVVNLTTTNEAVINLYAQWQKKFASATFDEQNHRLNLYYDTEDHSKDSGVTYLGKVSESYTQINAIPWLNMRENIYEVNLDPSVANWTPANTTYLFFGMKYVTELDLTYLNTSQTTNMYYMFANCTHLQKIYVGDGSLFTTTNVKTGNDVFTGDVKLKGQSGTAYSADRKDFVYARVDDPTNNSAGFFTASSLNKDETRFALIYESEADGYQVVDIPDDVIHFRECGEGEHKDINIVSENNPYRNRIVWEELSCWYYGDGAGFKAFNKGMPITIGVDTEEFKCNTVVLHAMWQPPYVYGINYSSDVVPKNDIDNMPESYTHKELEVTESDEVVSSKVPTALGYNFMYWYDTAGNKYYPWDTEENRTIHEIAGQPIPNLTAQWEEDATQKVVYTFFKDGTLTFYYGEHTEAVADQNDPRGEKIGQQVLPYYSSDDESTAEEKLPWYNIKGRVNAVKFDDSFASFSPEDGFDMSNWFKNMTGLFDINLANINTDNLTSCVSLFENCYNLNTIYDSESSPFAAPEDLSKSANMFKNCYPLKASFKGEVVSSYDPAHVDGSYAKIVTGTAVDGYFTEENDAPEPEKKYSYKILFSTDNADKVQNMPSSLVIPSDENPFPFALTWSNIGKDKDPYMTVGKLNFWGWRDEATGAYYYAGDEKTASSLTLTPSNQTINFKAVWGEGEDLRAKAYLVDIQNDPKLGFENNVGATGQLGLAITYENARDQINEEGITYLGEVPANATSPEDIPWHDVASKINAISIQKTMSEFDVQNISYWFSGLSNACTSLKGLSNLSFDKTAETRSIAHAFENSDLTNLRWNWIEFDTSTIEDFSYAFKGCRCEEGFDAGFLKLDKAKNFEGIFSEVMFNRLSLRGWDGIKFDTSRITNMNHMFDGAALLTTIYVDEGWSVKGAQTYINDEDMFKGCTRLIGGNGTHFDQSYIGSIRAVVDSVIAKRPITIFNAPVAVTYETQKGYLSFKPQESKYDYRVDYKYIDADGKERSYPFSQHSIDYIVQDYEEGFAKNYSFITVQGSENPSFNPEDTYEHPEGLEVTGWYYDKNSAGDYYDVLSGDYLNVTNVQEDYMVWDSNTGEYVITLYAYFSNKPCPYAFWHQPTKTLAFLYYPEEQIPNIKARFEKIYGENTITVLGQVPDNQTSAEELPWHQYRSKIDRVYFDNSFSGYKPTNLSYFFSDMPRLTDIDITLINTSMLNNINYMFSNDNHLRTVSTNSNFNLTAITPGTGRDVFVNCVKLVGLSEYGYDGDFAYDANKTNWQYARVNGFNSFTGYLSRPGVAYERFGIEANNLNYARLGILYEDVNLGTPPEDYIYWREMSDADSENVILQEYEVPYGYAFTGWIDVATGTVMPKEEIHNVKLTVLNTTYQLKPDYIYEGADERAYAIMDYKLRITDEDAELVGQNVHVYYDNKDPKEHTAVDSSGVVDYQKLKYDPATDTYSCGVEMLGEFDPNYDVMSRDGVPIPNLPWIYNPNTGSINTYNLNAITGFIFDESCRYNDVTKTGLKMENLECFFAYMPNIEKLDLTNLDMSHAKSMAYMFVQSPNAAQESEIMGSANAELPKVINNTFDSLVGVSYLTKDIDPNFKFRVRFGDNTVVPNPVIDPVSKGDSVDSKLSTIIFPQNVEVQSANINGAAAPGSVRFMFAGCTALKKIDMSKWNLNNVSDFEQMFYLCIRLNSIVWPTELKPANGPINNELAQIAVQRGYADELNGVNFYAMFGFCISLNQINLNTISLNITAEDNYTVDMTSMFMGCISLSNLSLPKDFNAYPYSLMTTFYACFSMQKLDLTNINTSKVRILAGCFAMCDTLETILANEQTWLPFQLPEGEEEFLGADVFEDCYSLVGGFEESPTIFNKEKTSYEYACIDKGSQSEQPGYLTGAPRTETGQTSNSYNILYKKGSLYHNGEQTIFDIPWTDESWPKDEYKEAVSDVSEFTISETEPVMKPDVNNNTIGNFNCYYKYSSEDIAKILIAQYDLGHFLERYGISIDLEVNPTLMHPGDKITLGVDSPYVWLEASAVFHKSFYLSYYGGEHSNATMPEPDMYVSGDSEHTFTISSQIPKCGDQGFLYYQDAEGNIYHPGDPYTIERTTSSSVEIRELTAVWSRNEYATLNNGILTIEHGTKDETDTQNLPDGFIGNVASTASTRSIYLLDALGGGSAIAIPAIMETDPTKSFPWYPYRNSITKIRFGNSFASVDHQRIMSNYYAYFQGLQAVSQADLTNFIISNNISGEEINLNHMFYGCTSLKTVYLNDRTWLYNSDTLYIRTSGMFGLCNNLVGGNGTKYTTLNRWNSSDFEPIAFLCVDSDDNLGLFTEGSWPVPEEGEVEYQVQYDAGEAANEIITNFPESIDVIEESNEYTVTLPTATIETVNYGRLIKWYAINSKTGNSIIYEPGSTITLTPDNSLIHLYSWWENQTIYTLNYRMSPIIGKIQEDVILPSTQYEYDATNIPHVMHISQDIPVWSNHDFLYWTDRDGNKYLPGDNIKIYPNSSGYANSREVVLYAQFEEHPSYQLQIVNQGPKVDRWVDFNIWNGEIKVYSSEDKCDVKIPEELSATASGFKVTEWTLSIGDRKETVKAGDIVHMTSEEGRVGKLTPIWVEDPRKAYVVYEPENNSMTMYFDNDYVESKYYFIVDTYYGDGAPWRRYSDSLEILTFDNSAKDYQWENLSYMFKDMYNLRHIYGLVNLSLKPGAYGGGYFMFDGCQNLQEINFGSPEENDLLYLSDCDYWMRYCQSATVVDINRINFDNVNYVSDMFYYMYNVQTIYANNENTRRLYEGYSYYDIFNENYNLVGAAGTPYETHYSEWERNGTMACVPDGKDHSKGYFTEGSLLTYDYYYSVETYENEEFTNKANDHTFAGEIPSFSKGSDEESMTYIIPNSDFLYRENKVFIFDKWLGDNGQYYNPGQTVTLTPSQQTLKLCPVWTDKPAEQVTDRAWFGLNMTTGTLTIYGSEDAILKSGDRNISDECGAYWYANNEWNDRPWNYKEEIRNAIKMVKTDESLDTFRFFPVSIASLFRDLPSLVYVDLTHLNTLCVYNMEAVFNNDYSLTEIDLGPHFYTFSSKTYSAMFSDCPLLSHIYTDLDFKFNSSYNDYWMFAYDTNLVGEKGSKCSTYGYEAKYARIDNGTDAPGYFTKAPKHPVHEEQYIVSVNYVTTDREHTLMPDGYKAYAGNLNVKNAPASQLLFVSLPKGDINVDKEHIPTTNNFTFDQWVDVNGGEIGDTLNYDAEAGQTNFNLYPKFDLNTGDKAISYSTIEYNANGWATVKMYYDNQWDERENVIKDDHENIKLIHDEPSASSWEDLSDPYWVSVPWFSYKNKILSIVVDPSFANCKLMSLRNLFQGLPFCSSIIMQDNGNPCINLEEVVRADCMFQDSMTLPVVDFSGYDFSVLSTQAANDIFAGCWNLRTIYFDSQEKCFANENSWTSMFSDCWGLKGGSGTTFKEISRLYAGDKERDPMLNIYAHIDGGENNPGYFTLSSQKPGTVSYPYLIRYNPQYVESGEGWSSFEGLINCPEAYHGESATSSATATISTQKPALSSGKGFAGWKDSNNPEKIYQPGESASLNFDGSPLILSLDSTWSNEVPWAYKKTNEDGSIEVLIGFGLNEQELIEHKYVKYESALAYKPWLSDSDVKHITKFVIDESMETVGVPDTNMYFRGFGNSEYVNSVSIEGLEYLNAAGIAGTMYSMFESANMTKFTPATIEGIENLNVSSVSSFESMFKNAIGPDNLDLSGWDVSKGNRFGNMFYKYNVRYSLANEGWDNTSLDVSGWHIYENATSTDVYSMFYNMFAGVTVATIDMGNWTFSNNIPSSQGEYISRIFADSTVRTIFASNQEHYIFPDFMFESSYGMLSQMQLLRGGNGTMYNGDEDFRLMRVDERRSNDEPLQGYFTEPINDDSLLIQYMSNDGTKLLSGTFVQVAKKANKFDVQGIGEDAFSVYDEQGMYIDTSKYGWCLEPGSSKAEFNQHTSLFVNQLTSIEDHVAKLYYAEKFEAYAHYDSNSSTLIFDYGMPPAENTWPIPEYVESYYDIPWYQYCHSIQNICFEDNFKNYSPTTMKYWFYDMNNVISVKGGYNLNFDRTRSFEYTFCITTIRDCWNEFFASLKTFMVEENYILYLNYMFANAEICCNLDLSDWDLTHAQSSESMFASAHYPEGAFDYSINLDNWSWEECSGFVRMFEDCKASNFSMANWDFSQCIYLIMDQMFKSSDALNEATGAQITEWEVKGIVSFYEMFLYYSEKPVPLPKTLNFTGWELRNRIEESVYIEGMFYNRKLFPENHVGNIDIYANRITDSNMFYKADLSELGSHELDYLMGNDGVNHHVDGSWGYNVFCNAIMPSNGFLSLRNWNMSYDGNISYMFQDSIGLKVLDITDWGNLYKPASGPRDYEQGVTQAYGMFAGCTELRTVYSNNTGWVEYVGAGDMFAGCDSLVGGNGTVYNQKYKDNIQAAIPDSKGKPGLFTYSGDEDEIFRIEYYSSTGKLYDQVIHQVKDPVATIGGYTLNFNPEQGQRGWATEAGAYASYYNGDTYNFPEGQHVLQLYATNQGLPPKEFYGIYNSVNGTLTFNYASPPESVSENEILYKDYGTEKWPVNVDTWKALPWGPQAANIQHVVFHDSCSNPAFQITNMAYWFAQETALETVDFGNLDTSSLTNTSYMFSIAGKGSENAKLKTLDLSKWDTSSLSNMEYMFQNMTALQTIIVGTKWTVATNRTEANYNIDGQYVFVNTPNLVGGNGTKYNPEYEGSKYGNRACIDWMSRWGDFTPGYLTPDTEQFNCGVVNYYSLDRKLLFKQTLQIEQDKRYTFFAFRTGGMYFEDYTRTALDLNSIPVPAGKEGYVVAGWTTKTGGIGNVEYENLNYYEVQNTSVLNLYPVWVPSDK